MADWFQENAPKTNPQGDWFTAHAPTDVYSSPGRKPGAAEATNAYLDENAGKAILGPKVEHTVGSLVSEFLQGLPMAVWRENERITSQPIRKTLKEAALNGLKAGLPITQIPGMLMAQLDEAKKAYRDFKEGDTAQAIGHAGAAAIPALGPMASAAGEQIARGDTAGGLARGAGVVTLAAAPALQRGVQQAPSGIRGAYQEATAPAMVNVKMKGVPVSIEVPGNALAANAAAGASTGAAIGATIPGVTAAGGAAVGGVAGALRPIVRGYRKGTAAFRAAQQQALLPPRAPVVAPPANIAPVTPQPQAAPAPSAPGTLPSGRRPGGIQNQAATPVNPVTPAVVDPLDAIAADIGYTKPYAQLKASQQLEVKIAQKAADQAAAKAGSQVIDPAEISNSIPFHPIETPAPKPPVNTAFKDAFDKAVAKLKEKGEVPQEYEFGKQTQTPAGELARFDMSESGVPVIDSTKSRFNRPVANPQLLRPEQLTQHIDRLEKMTNRSAGETNLLNQLREEVKKRGIK